MSIRRWKITTYSKPSWQSSPAISVRLPPRGIPPSPPTPTFGMLVHCRQPPRIAIRESLILGIDWPRMMHRIVTERRPFIAPIFLSLSIVLLQLRFPENNINGKTYKKKSRKGIERHDNRKKLYSLAEGDMLLSLDINQSLLGKTISFYRHYT